MSATNPRLRAIVVVKVEGPHIDHVVAVRPLLLALKAAGLDVEYRTSRSLPRRSGLRRAKVDLWVADVERAADVLSALPEVYEIREGILS